jgi:DGQHR domain-containing protein
LSNSRSKNGTEPETRVTRRAHIEMRFPALEVRQGKRRRLYSFAVDGKQLPLFTTISRLHRDEETGIGGYQRPEVLSHIAEIRSYLESPDPMIPNAIVIAFDRSVRFEPSEVQPLERADVRPGQLIVRLDPNATPEHKPGWIVDGQQRAAAIRDANISRFPICVTAFVTDSAHEQREQFILVNSTKPLPKGLIYELLPSTEARLPSALERRRLPSQLLERLNHDTDSPLRGVIQTPTSPTGKIKDNSILKMLEHSLTDGALFGLRRSGDDDRDTEAMLSLLKIFWAAVATVFSDAWDLPPRRSRLMHGAGVVSMGFLMDAIVDRYRRHGALTTDQVVENLRPLRPICRWTAGEWLFASGARRRWNEIQNTPKDIELLVDHLLDAYRTRVWSRTRQVASARA